MISNSSILMACLSPDYQSSKYCRREIKFADLIGKPIIPIAQKPITWADGLRFSFQELQICALTSGDAWDKLLASLAHLTGAISGATSSAASKDRVVLGALPPGYER